MKLKFIPLIKDLYNRYETHDVAALSAQMTYYLILSIFPFLIFIMTVISYTPLTSEDILMNVKPIFATNAFETIEDFVNGVLESNNTTLLSFGMLGTIWSSSSGVMAIINGFNKAYNTPEVRPFWKVRGIAMLYVLGLGTTILLSFIMVVFGHTIGQQLFKLLQSPTNIETVWAWAKYLIPLCIMYMVFTFLFRRIPNHHISFREALPGATFSTLGWVITSILFAYYVNNWGNYTKIYGSIGGIIVLLVWLYISSIITLIGGEINAAIAQMRKNQI
ncbi:YihY/virulence factor BrkB family protein [Paenibacillus albiflavus]|uniref:YihY/virulence factor BrkB family protein n=1 Tax=Paenibacillus albiflavus TaxID=2545760 RepID=A0A4R4DXX3_9BACL|nr:YihY/virulence factor BrkB family protein [Paenibacillus albiflavus]TCZ69873.1 YihY/virulence factor BrkB family protein [Paenibacillus albiflavus]